MAAFSTLAMLAIAGIGGAVASKSLSKSSTAPGPTTALGQTEQPPSTILGAATPPDAAAAKSTAMTEAQKAAMRQRKKAAGVGQTAATSAAGGLSMNPPASMTPRTLLGY